MPLSTLISVFSVIHCISLHPGGTAIQRVSNGHDATMSAVHSQGYVSFWTFNIVVSSRFYRHHKYLQVSDQSKTHVTQANARHIAIDQHSALIQAIHYEQFLAGKKNLQIWNSNNFGKDLSIISPQTPRPAHLNVIQSFLQCKQAREITLPTECNNSHTSRALARIEKRPVQKI